MVSLSELLGHKARSPKSVRIGTRNVMRVSGRSKISMEKTRLLKKGKIHEGHPDFITYSALSALETSLCYVVGEPNKFPNKILQALLHEFQEEQRYLVEALQEILPEAEKSREWLRERSQEMQSQKTVSEGLIDALIFSPERCSGQFLMNARSHAERIEVLRMRGVSYDDASAALDQSRQWIVSANDRVRTETERLKTEYKHSLAHLKLLASTNADASTFALETYQHIVIVERASDIERTLEILETQLGQFWDWRKSDVYKQVIKAYEAEIKLEDRLMAANSVASDHSLKL